MNRLIVLVVMALSMVLAGCSESTSDVAPPVAMVAPDDAIGYYCGMLLPEHAGPKGQIHLASRERPFWFTSVHDTVVFMRLPEEPRDITAVYVHDMGKVKDWDDPDDIWIDIETAWFVLNSDMRGGMGMPEAVPFSSEVDAQSFVEDHGGDIMRLADIPDTYFSGLTEGGDPHDMHEHHH